MQRKAATAVVALLLVAAASTAEETAHCQPAPKECVFPFIYKDAMYHSCTKKSFDRLWCATAVDDNNHYIAGSWTKCQKVCVDRMTPDVCQPPPEDCIFPFIYKAKLFDRCTYMDSRLPWCATAVNPGGYFSGQWKTCENVCDDSDACKPPPADCVFPFRYRGVVHTACTREGYDHSWCATSLDRHGSYQPGRWAICENVCSSHDEDVPEDAVDRNEPRRK